MLTSLWLGGTMGIAQAAVFGQLDSAYARALPAGNGEIKGIASAAGNKCLVWGKFHRVGEARRVNLAQLNSDGSLDVSFDAGLSALCAIFKAAGRADGKVLVTGELYETDGTVLPAIVRLNSDGSRDESFQCPANIGIIQSFHLLPSQKLLVAGLLFPSVQNYAQAMLVRLNEDGSVDSTFNSVVKSGIYTVEPTSDDRVLVGGQLSGGRKTVRLLPNGQLDDTFTAASTMTQTDFRVAPSGYIFRPSNSLNHGGVVRFFPDGAEDSSFTCDFGEGSYSHYVVPLQSGKVLVQRREAGVNGATQLVLLNDSGTVEQIYSPPVSLAAESNARELADGSVVVLTVNRPTTLRRVHTDGSMESDYSPGFFLFHGGSRILPTKEGMAYVETINTRKDADNNNYDLLRLKNDGELDPAFDYTVNNTEYPLLTTLLGNGNLILQDRSATTGIHNLKHVDASGSVIREQANQLPPLMLPWGNWVAFPDGRAAVGRFFSQFETDDRPFLSLFTADFSQAAGFPIDSSEYVVRLVTTPKGNLMVERMTIVSLIFQIDFDLIRIKPNGEQDSSFIPLPLTNGMRMGATDVKERVYQIRPPSTPSRRMISNPNNALPTVPTYPPVVRLKADGTMDESFNVTLGKNSSVDTLFIQKDGRILVTGKLLNAAETMVNTLVRLMPDGSVDESFAQLEEIVPITVAAVEMDGNILIGGSFDQIGGQSLAGVARLKSMELPQMRNVTFTEGGLKVQLDGNAGRTWLIQASDDLENWTTVATVTTGSETETVDVPAPGSGSKFYRAVLAP